MRTRRGIAFAAAVGLSIGWATQARAQQTRGSCRSAERVGWIGIEQFECNCTVSVARAARVSTRPGVSQWTFRSEPVVGEIAEGSPAEGVLRRGDVIVAVDGQLITTAEGGRRFSSPTPGRPMVLAIRREGRRSTVRLTPAGLCPMDARLGRPATPQATPEPNRVPVPRASEAPQQRPVAAPTAAAPPAPPGRLLPTGRLGFGYACSECGWERGRRSEEPIWYFRAPPQVYSVEAGSPAARAGLQRGDVITHVDGLAITSEAGARRFSAVRPDESVRYTIRRGGSIEQVALRAGDRSAATDEARSSRQIRQDLERIGRLRDLDDVRRELLQLTRRLEPPPPAQPLPSAQRTDESPASNQLRYTGAVGTAEVEVRGSGSVITTIIEAGKDLLIITDGARIRIRAADAREDRAGGR